MLIVREAPHYQHPLKELRERERQRYYVATRNIATLDSMQPPPTSVSPSIHHLAASSSPGPPTVLRHDAASLASAHQSTPSTVQRASTRPLSAMGPSSAEGNLELNPWTLEIINKLPMRECDMSTIQGRVEHPICKEPEHTSSQGCPVGRLRLMDDDVLAKSRRVWKSLSMPSSSHRVTPEDPTRVHYWPMMHPLVESR